MAVVGIMILWTAGLGWMTLLAIVGLAVLICVRGVVVRRQHERWMDDLARATQRLLRPSSVRRTTSWPDD